MPKQLSEGQIAYVAAIIDTTARIKELKTSSGVMIPVIHLSNANFGLLRYLGRITDVQPLFLERKWSRHKCSEHCPDRHQEARSVSGRWSISGAKATMILAAIQPHVMFQKAVVRESIALGLDAPRKQATVRKMINLGWPVPEEWQ